MKLFNKIMCPVDLDHHFDALDYAIKVAQDSQASLYVLNVCEIPIAATEVAAGFSDKEYPYWELANRDRMEKLIKERLAGAVNFETEVCSGEASQWIVDRAAEHGVDLIVMASHGRAGLSGLILGSVTHAVMRHATCPVLVIKSPRAAR